MSFNTIKNTNTTSSHNNHKFQDQIHSNCRNLICVICCWYFDLWPCTGNFRLSQGSSPQVVAHRIRIFEFPGLLAGRHKLCTECLSSWVTKRRPVAERKMYIEWKGCAEQVTCICFSLAGVLILDCWPWISNCSPYYCGCSYWEYASCSRRPSHFRISAPNYVNCAIYPMHFELDDNQSNNKNSNASYNCRHVIFKRERKQEKHRRIQCGEGNEFN